jgi:hypothetical protein
MAIAVQCSCGKRFKAKDDQAGKKFKCPQCGTSIVVPRPEKKAGDEPLVTFKSPHATITEAADDLTEDFLANHSATTKAVLPPDPFAAIERLNASVASDATTRRPHGRTTIFKIVVIVLALGFALVATLVIVLFVGGTYLYREVKKTVAQHEQSLAYHLDANATFNPKDISETARWTARVLEPLNSMPASANEIARENAIQAELAKVNAQIGPLVGQIVSWKMECHVFDTHVLLFGRFSKNGNGVTHDAYGDHLILMPLDDRPKEDEYGRDAWSEFPNDRFFNLDIPEKLSRDDAAKLTETVSVTGRIKELEIGRFEVASSDDLVLK